MRKLLYTLPIAAILGVGTASAQFASDRPEGGSHRPGAIASESQRSGDGQPEIWQGRSAAEDSAPITNAGDVVSGQNDQRVQLVGVILDRVGNYYLFSDDTGEAVVVMGLPEGQVVPVGSEVEIEGAVEASTRASPHVAAEIVTVIVALPAPLPEQSTRQEGSSPTPIPTTAQDVIQDAVSARDDEQVWLRGRILSQQSRNRYMFSDGTDNVIVEVSDRVLNGQQLAAGSEVEIEGRIDRRDRAAPKVEAKSVTVLAASDIAPAGSRMDGLPPAGGRPDERG